MTTQAPAAPGVAQIQDRRVQGLPAPGGPQVQGVAAGLTAKIVIDILAQVGGKHPAGCRARAVQRARPTPLLAPAPARLVSDQLQDLGQADAGTGCAIVKGGHGWSPGEQGRGTRNGTSTPQRAFVRALVDFFLFVLAACGSLTWPLQKRCSSKACCLRSMWKILRASRAARMASALPEPCFFSCFCFHWRARSLARKNRERKKGQREFY
jgi:hypothetical protein